MPFCANAKCGFSIESVALYMSATSIHGIANKNWAKGHCQDKSIIEYVEEECWQSY